jgi:prepilin-type N-terminal cleavage/methylation domain-containing protein
MRMIPFDRLLKNTRRRGFTLVELAIALLVAGLILGAVWVAAGNVWSNYRLYRTNQELAKLTQNVREYYMNAQAVPALNITLTLDGLNLFPFEMRRDQNAAPGLARIDHPFNSTWPGGSVAVLGVACPGGASVTCFRVQMFGLAQNECARLLAYIPVNNSDLGIAQVFVPLGGLTVQNPTVMITLSQAEAACNQAGANNEVDWDFKLRN